VLTTQVLGETEWTPNLLQTRQQTLLQTLKSLWSLDGWDIATDDHGEDGGSAGKRGLRLNYVVTEHATRVELYIDRGQGSKAENKAIFDELHAKRGEIESAFGDQLAWWRLDDRRACAITYSLKIGGWRDPEKWPQIHESTTDAMIRLENALRNAVAALPP
jgi:hypothetical protein